MDEIIATVVAHNAIVSADTGDGDESTRADDAVVDRVLRAFSDVGVDIVSPRIAIGSSRRLSLEGNGRGGEYLEYRLRNVEYRISSLILHTPRNIARIRASCSEDAASNSEARRIMNILFDRSLRFSGRVLPTVVEQMAVEYVFERCGCGDLIRNFTALCPWRLFYDDYFLTPGCSIDVDDGGCDHHLRCVVDESDCRRYRNCKGRLHRECSLCSALICCVAGCNQSGFCQVCMLSRWLSRLNGSTSSG